MHDQRRQIWEVTFVDWRELRNLIDQGWIVNVVFATTVSGTREIHYHLATDRNHRNEFVWVNDSNESFHQAIELVTSDMHRLHSHHPCARKNCTTCH